MAGAYSFSVGLFIGSRFTLGIDIIGTSNMFSRMDSLASDWLDCEFEINEWAKLP